MKFSRISVGIGSLVIAILPLSSNIGVASAATIQPLLVTGNMQWLLSPDATDQFNGYEFTISTAANNVTAEIAQSLSSGTGTIVEEFRMIAVSGGRTSAWQTVTGSTGNTAAKLIYSLPAGTYALEVWNKSNTATVQGNAYVFFS